MSNQNMRKYRADEVVVFRKTKEEFGGLSNMAGGYPIKINNTVIFSSEALYQACRYPHLPDVQREIILQISPMTAKMKSKKYRKETREDWEEIRIQVMRWVLRVKLFKNWESFSSLLLSTGSRDIVEYSTKDDFWGAKPVDRNLLLGTNALGRLLMELREELKTYKEGENLLVPLNIKNFRFLSLDIPPISSELSKIENKKVIKEIKKSAAEPSLFD